MTWAVGAAELVWFFTVGCGFFFFFLVMMVDYGYWWWW